MSENQLTVGVLGHVDHGKTALVKALTGVDTDRLEEEKRRGMSIVLGFAYLQTDQGVIDFIDAPGHENFIRTMIAGATGIDAVILVVAADEGINEQTREHFSIAQLLGIQQGVIVLSKSDLVDDNQLSQVQQEVEELAQGTFLESAQSFSVSVQSETGLDKLREGLSSLIATKPTRLNTDAFYLPLDRVFSIEGFGTVGTGTLRNGVLKKNDEIEVMPGSEKAAVRELQVHNKKVEQALPGERVAVNLRGIKREQLNRGDVLLKPNSIRLSQVLYVRFHLLEDVPRLPKRNEIVRLLFGTQEVLAKIRPIGNDVLEKGASILVQLRCREAVMAYAGEHFIARSCSPAYTFGGGEIIETNESLLSLPAEALIDHLRQLEESDAKGRVQAQLKVAGQMGVAISSLVISARTSADMLKDIVKDIGALVIAETLLVDQAQYKVLQSRMLDLLKTFHEKNPTKTGQSLELWRNTVSEAANPSIVEHLIDDLARTKRVKVIDNLVQLAEFSSMDQLQPSEKALTESIAEIFYSAGMTTPSLQEVVGSDPEKKRAYEYLINAGILISVNQRGNKNYVIFHQDTLSEIKADLLESFPPPVKFTASDFRVMTGSSRKYIIPLLEYFDRTHVTLRIGNDRVLTAKSEVAA